MQNCSRREFVAAGIGLAAAAPAFALAPMKRASDQARIKLSLAAYSFRGALPNYRSGKPAADPEMTMLDFIDYCASQDLDGTEITGYFIPDPTPSALIHQIKRRAHVNGLAISGGAIGNNFSYPDGPELDKQMAYTERWIKTYAAMGAPVIRIFAGHPKKGGDEKAAIKNIIRNLNKAGEIAGQHGVMLAIENHDFTTHIDRLLEVLDGVDSPWIGINLDTGNIAPTPDPYNELERIAPYAVNVQLKVKIPVNGKKEEADIPRLVKMLKDQGYRGFLVLEYEEADPKTHVPVYLDKMRGAL